MKKGLLTISLLLGLSVFGLVFFYSFAFHAFDSQDDLSQFASVSKNLIASPIDGYYASAQVKSNTLAAVGKSDSRPVIVDNFLAKHNSPMSGLGSVFVSTADKYGLDYRLMPAIAFQESTLGKKIPRNSHNAWGWAIYTGANSGAKFKDWVHAIDVVAEGLKTDYIDRGLTTPEAIMTRYSDSDGSWAFGVNFAINEMTPQ